MTPKTMESEDLRNHDVGATLNSELGGLECGSGVGGLCR